MHRKDLLKRLGYDVPAIKQKRVIVHADLAAEADDQFAMAHHLLTPSENVVGIIAANFEWRFRTIPALQGQRLQSLEKSYAEGETLLHLMEIDDVPLFKGAPDCINAKKPMPVSEGSAFIVQEAMRASDEPLYLALQGTLTDLAVAYLTEPRIAQHITAAIWIGGAAYPQGGRESNLQQDIAAANIVFASPIPVWQIPSNVYSGSFVTFAELMDRVKPCGAIGAHLCDTMLGVNSWYGQVARRMPFPHGEVWSLGDQPTVGVLLQSESGSQYHTELAPHIKDDMTYEAGTAQKEIRVYDAIDHRVMFEDFFAKLKLCYSSR